jgi:hypothetical protein
MRSDQVRDKMDSGSISARSGRRLIDEEERREEDSEKDYYLSEIGKVLAVRNSAAAAAANAVRAAVVSLVQLPLMQLLLCSASRHRQAVGCPSQLSHCPFVALFFFILPLPCLATPTEAFSELPPSVPRRS